MKKAILKNEVQFNFMFELNGKVRDLKIKKLDFEDREIEYFKGQMLKSESVESKMLKTLLIGTDKNSITIKKYDEFYIITELKNYYASAFPQSCKYYKLPLLK